MSKKLERILYVEDEPDIRTIAQIALEDIGGFTMKFCASGKEALSVAVAFNPDLLLLDVMMPGLDGPATLVELRKLPELATTPAIFVTAKMQPNEIEAYKKAGAIEVITKPFDPMSLANIVKKIWSEHNE